MINLYFQSIAKEEVLDQNTQGQSLHKVNRNGQDWRTALTRYNGSPDYATAVMNKWNNGNGIFKEIIE